MGIEKYGAGGEKLSQAQMQLFEFAPVVSEMIEEAEGKHAPVHRPTKRSTLRILRATSGFCLAHRVAGPKVAAIFSVVKSCRRLQVPSQDQPSHRTPVAWFMDAGRPPQRGKAARHRIGRSAQRGENRGKVIARRIVS